MSIFDIIKNPFAVMAGGINRNAQKGIDAEEKAQQAEGNRIQQLAEVEWLRQQDHGRNMNFLQAQHGNSLELEAFRGNESRTNMAAAREHGLSDFSTQTGPDGSHATSFRLRKQRSYETPASPLAGASIRDTGVQATDQRAPQQAQMAAGSTNSTPPGSPSGSRASKAPKAPKHSGAATKGARQYKLL